MDVIRPDQFIVFLKMGVLLSLLDVEGGFNTYNYVDSNPISRVDPKGQWWFVAVLSRGIARALLRGARVGVGARPIPRGPYGGPVVDLRPPVLLIPPAIVMTQKDDDYKCTILVDSYKNEVDFENFGPGKNICLAAALARYRKCRAANGKGCRSKALLNVLMCIFINPRRGNMT